MDDDLFAYAEQHPEESRAAVEQAPICNPVAPPPHNPCTLPAEPPQEAVLLAQVLARCIGRTRSMTAPAIAAAAELWPDMPPADRGTKARQVIRTWYEAFALPGYVLIASTAGFWYSDDPLEFAAYDATMLSRIHETALTLRRSRLQARVSAGFSPAGKARWTRPA